MCRLKQALYGHPDAGTYWEQKCDAHVRSAAFVPISPEWPSCYYHPKLSLMLSVYADDFKMAGSKKILPLGWKLLRQGLHLEPEKRIDENGTVYLGSRHVVLSVKLPNGTTATTTTYDMECILTSCVDKYKSVIGPKVPLRQYSTAFMPEGDRDSPVGAPGAGPVRECPWCFRTGPPQSFLQ